MRQAWKVPIFGALLALCVPLVAAQVPTRPMDGPRYDPATEMTVKGTVEAVTTRGRTYGMGSTHLTVKTEEGTMEVRLGPTWFLEQNKMTFAKGDQVEVIGSRVTFGTKQWVIAREVKKGWQTLTLRDAKGVPMWPGKVPDWQERIGIPPGIT